MTGKIIGVNTGKIFRKKWTKKAYFLNQNLSQNQNRNQKVNRKLQKAVLKQYMKSIWKCRKMLQMSPKVKNNKVQQALKMWNKIKLKVRIVDLQMTLGRKRRQSFHQADQSPDLKAGHHRVDCHLEAAETSLSSDHLAKRRALKPGRKRPRQVRRQKQAYTERGQEAVSWEVGRKIHRRCPQSQPDLDPAECILRKPQKGAGIRSKWRNSSLASRQDQRASIRYHQHHRARRRTCRSWSGFAQSANIWMSSYQRGFAHAGASTAPSRTWKYSR